MNAATATPAVPASESTEWNRLARIMSASAAGALLSGLLSAGATKILALVAGPAAIGLLATLQQVRQFSLTAATANGQTALVQGASSLRGWPRCQYLRTVSLIFLAATTLAAAALWLAPLRIGQWSGLDLAHSGLIRWLAPALLLSSLYVFLTALLNALGAAHSLAWLQLVGPGAMVLFAWPAARSSSPLAFPILLAASACVTVVAAGVALLPYRRALAAWIRPAAERGTEHWRHSAAHFFSISGAMLATGLAGSAAVVVVRARILRAQGLDGAGQFDAAWSISMNQVSLVLASLQTHYLPSLARLENARERSVEIGRVLALAAPASAVLIAVLAVARPFWLGLLYSSHFYGASRYLRWTLLGDYLKVTSWILSIPMLAAADMRIFVLADLAASATYLGSALALARFRLPAEAAGIAFVLMHVVHLAICAVYVRRRHAFRDFPARLWTGGLALVGMISVWRWNT